jgi:phospholipid transport system substrate-binding protein
MKLVRLAQAAVFALSLSIASSALADDAQGYMQTQHTSMTNLLKQPASGSRDAQIATLLDGMIDYDELVRRSFGEPCPAAVPSCTNHWKQLTDAQKTEMVGLIKKLVQKNYRKNLIKTLDYEISYKGEKAQSGDFRVKTEAKSKVKPRDPAVQIDYILKPASSSYKVVDIVTEGSSLTKNYYDQFHKMLTTDGQGYPYIVQKVNTKINAI